MEKTYASQILSSCQPSETLRLAAELDQLQEHLKIAKKNFDSWGGFFEDSPAIDAIKKEIEKVENKLRDICKKSEH